MLSWTRTLLFLAALAGCEGGVDEIEVCGLESLTAGAWGNVELGLTGTGVVRVNTGYEVCDRSSCYDESVEVRTTGNFTAQTSNFFPSGDCILFLAGRAQEQLRDALPRCSSDGDCPGDEACFSEHCEEIGGASNLDEGTHRLSLVGPDGEPDSADYFERGIETSMVRWRERVDQCASPSTPCTSAPDDGDLFLVGSIAEEVVEGDHLRVVAAF